MFLTHIPDDAAALPSLNYEIHGSTYSFDLLDDDYSCDWMRDSECFALCDAA